MHQRIKKRLRIIGIFSLTALGQAWSQTPPTPAAWRPEAVDWSGTGEAHKQLAALNAQTLAMIAEDRKNGVRRPARDWTEILGLYDAILDAHGSDRSDDVAQVAMQKGMFYEWVLHAPDRAVECLRQMVKDYPGTPSARLAELFIAQYQGAANFLLARRAMIGQPMPGFRVQDTNGQILSLSDLKGKVVLFDYWATTCAPCLNEMPAIQKIYMEQHKEGFEVVGLIYDNMKSMGPQLPTFLKEHHMPWREVAVTENIKLPFNEAPANYLLGRDGKIIGLDLFGTELQDAVAKALAKKIN